ncbi:MAG TPA: nucleotide-binding protein, partial [Methanocorpusculum sp.]|nr:nucleotide-binding protein [Methanocorpusculum sp.]
MDVQHIQQITNRISLKLQNKGVSPDTQSIFDKLASYINEFGVAPNEAERKVQSDLFRKLNIPEDPRPNQELTSMGSGNPQSPVRKLNDLVDGDWVTVDVKVMSVQKPRFPSIAQKGVIADDTGAVGFTIFSKTEHIPLLEAGKWYRIENCTVSAYRGNLAINIHSGTTVTAITEDRVLAAPEPTPLSEIKLGIIPCIEAKFTVEWECRSDRMLQTGLLYDRSGRTKFVIWEDTGKEKLKLNSVYRFFYPTVTEYNGNFSLILD